MLKYIKLFFLIYNINNKNKKIFFFEFLQYVNGFFNMLYL